MRVNELKQALRKQVEAMRRSLGEVKRSEYSQAICRRILNDPRVMALQPEDAILTYMPMRAEVDVKPVMEWAWSRGLHVLLPRVNEGSRLTLHRIGNYEELVQGAWNIWEPPVDAEAWEMTKRIHAALIPGVAYDHKGNRLGQGGGYYDRLLERWQSPGRQAVDCPYIIAPAFHVQVVDCIPTEPHDLKVDVVVTESGSY